MKRRTKALLLGALSVHIVKAVVFSYAVNAWWNLAPYVVWRGGW